MSIRQLKIVLAIGAAVVLGGGAAEAWAWGPATHVKVASDVLANLALLPAAVAALLARHGRDFVYGTIAADFVFAKKLSRVRQFCHHWATGYALLEDAETESSRAFAHGYLSHLAADTVAHNKFLPRQFALTRSTLRFGHLYWEVRADCQVDAPFREQVERLLHRRFREHEASLSISLTDTFLPFELNRRLFRRMTLVTTYPLWGEAMRRWHDRSRWELCEELVRQYQSEATERTLSILSEGPKSKLLHEDPSGNAALGFARHQRRQLRQMARAGVLGTHVWDELHAQHAPVLGESDREAADVWVQST